MPRAKTPTLIQMEAAECGAVALGIILAYHGKYVSLEELRIACGVSRDGSTASAIVKAARHYGLETHGYRKEPRSLLALPLPAMVFWNFNHFVVLEGFGKNSVYINDPRSGPRRITMAEFDASFTGIVLTFEQTANFVRTGQRQTLLRALSYRLRGSEIGLVYVVFVSLLLIMPGLLLPTAARILIDDILINQTMERLGGVLMMMGVLAGLGGLLTWLQLSSLLRLEMKMMTSMSANFFWHLLRLPIEFFWQRAAGELTNRVELNNWVVRLLTGEVATAVFGLVLVALYGAALWFLDAGLALIVFAGALINLMALQIVSRRRRDAQHELLQETARLTGMTTSGIYIIETLKASGAENSFFARWAGQHALLLTAQQRAARLSLAFWSVPLVVTFLINNMVLLVGSLRVLDQPLTIGLLVVFQGWMVSFLSPINALMGFGTRLQEAQAQLARLDDVLRYPVRTTPDTPQIGALSGQITLENVTFGYNRLESPFIADLNLTIISGQRVALVGRSGSGKSTLARLIAGLYTPWEGRVTFDDVTFPAGVIPPSLAMVEQDIVLLEGSARDNLTLWDKTITPAMLESAAHDACIHDDLMKRAGGYDCYIAENGSNFSGGQRQRLELARALATEPSILILDEATSALDALTEQRVLTNLQRRGCTCFVIAHRLSTIRHCDLILVLADGKIIEQGKHEPLLAAGGEYARLVQHELVQ